MVFTNPTGEVSPAIQGWYTDSPIDVDPQTGMQVIARRIRASIHFSDLTIGDPTEIAGIWRVRFTNSDGELVDGAIESPRRNRTLGMLAFVVKPIEVLGAA